MMIHLASSKKRLPTDRQVTVKADCGKTVTGEVVAASWEDGRMCQQCQKKSNAPKKWTVCYMFAIAVDAHIAELSDGGENLKGTNAKR
jgi:hypothetical protein